MHILFLSDIHANKYALEAVLDHAFSIRSNYYKIYSLGDAIGYGPHPAEVLRILQYINSVNILGNHEEDLLNLVDGKKPATIGTASEALIWQMGRLKRYIKYIRSWETFIDDYHINARLSHGSPTSIREYLDKDDVVKGAFQKWSGDLAFVGHTHLPGYFAALKRDSSIIRREKFRILDNKNFVSYRIPPAVRIIFNPGSVGQPRDHDNRASYGIFDSEERVFRIYRVEYNIEQTKKDIKNANLPIILAERLLKGR